VDDDGHLAALGTTVDAPLPIGPSTIAFTRPADSGGVYIESLDLATGKLAKLGHHGSASDRLLNVRPGQLTFLVDGRKLVTESGAAPPVIVEVPSVGN